MTGRSLRGTLVSKASTRSTWNISKTNKKMKPGSLRASFYLMRRALLVRSPRRQHNRLVLLRCPRILQFRRRGEQFVAHVHFTNPRFRQEVAIPVTVEDQP